VIQACSRLSRALALALFLGLACTAGPGAAAASDLLPFLSAEGGYQFSHLTYKEPSLNVREKGWLHGVFARGTLHAPPGLMVRAEGDASRGNLDYDGSTWGGTPLTSSGADRLINARLLTGWDFSFGKWALTPYAGLGWRYWYDRQDGSGFYTRETTYAYLPLGAEMNMRLGEKWRLKLQGEVDLWLGGKNRSRLSEADPGLNDVDLTQNQGVGWMVSAGLAREMGLFALRVEPFFWYWDVKQSDTEALYWTNLRLGRVYEPDNGSATWGLRLTVEF
jgi:hypothetical protein